MKRFDIVDPIVAYYTDATGRQCSVVARDAKNDLNIKQIKDAFVKLEQVIEGELDRLSKLVDSTKLGNDVIKVADKNLEPAAEQISKIIRTAYDYTDPEHGLTQSLGGYLETWLEEIVGAYNELQNKYNAQAQEERTRLGQEAARATTNN